MTLVHPASIVDPRAELADGVRVGPFAVVEAGAVLGPECVIHTHAIVRAAAKLGSGNVVHPFAVVGADAQTKHRVSHGGGRVIVGEGNVFREYVTVHAGTEGRVTTIGAHNLFMVGAHVAHDVLIGSHCVFANGVQLAGHAVVEDWATFGGLSGVTQRVRVGESAFVAATAACERDVPPFVIVQGHRARVRGINVVGLRRRGIPEGSIRALRRALHGLVVSREMHAEARRVLPHAADPYVRRLLAAIAGTH